MASFRCAEAAHAAFMGINLSVCTSAASGTMAMSVQVTKTLACKVAPLLQMRKPPKPHSMPYARLKVEGSPAERVASNEEKC